MEYSLVMTFKTAGDSKANVTIKDVWPLITRENIVDLMNTIIAQNIFETKTGDLVAKLNAKVIKNDADEYKLS